MAACVTRKRDRLEDEDDLPPAKREPTQVEGIQSGVSGSGAQAVGQADGRVATGEPGVVVKRDDEFWLEDGTVILVARNVEFRVYRGLLAGLSPVFKALFAESKRQDSRRVGSYGKQDLLCPVVRVEDSPEDLRRLLRVCFTNRLGRLYDERQPSYYEISAAIRLGKRYEISELCDQSLEYLKRYFPNTFDGWMVLRRYGPPDWDDFEEIGVVNLARLTGELSILPSAIIACIVGPGDGGIGHGIAREDGSREHLSADDLTVCFDGKTSLRAASIAAVLRTFKPAAAEGCEVPAECEDALREVLLGLERMLDLLLTGDPFVEYEAFVDRENGLGVCGACKDMVRGRSLKERKDVWDRLPELLDIDVPGWRE